MVYNMFYIIVLIFFIHVEENKAWRTDLDESDTGSYESFYSCEENIIVDAKSTYSDQCNLTLPSPKMIINPYKLIIQNHVGKKAFNSIYLKCVSCLAVAEQVRYFK